ncbi:MAG: glucose 1-dehydrogenase [Cetobacterium sp.]|uniref:glucose 1-dehydrogenase n=2 Tax=Fusobacteriaceae TaxID=203492 RepID=UPI001F05D166|nr:MULTISPECIES: glucose 1-dehydrogenase [Cetobacterium]MCX3066954.1 glucose 1-dehydrogenase [Cetobacterium somerae]UPO98478.1 glucose 1-dehydrogenase [Cetobacterium somerae]
MFKIENHYNLKGMVAIITGAGAGIGKASALMLARAGANIVCADLNKVDADNTAIEARGEGVKAIGVKCDVTSIQDLEEVVKATIQEFGKINILVNNAGGGGGGREKFLELTPEYLQKIYNLNVFSIFNLSRLCAPHMIASEYGSIVNISSMASLMQSHNMSVYGSSKAAINQLTKYMAVDLGPIIRVNAIAPGAIKTHALATVLTPELEEVMLKKTPMKVLGEADDIAMAVFFLASPLSKWITGQILPVNGGGEQDLEG